MKLGRIRPSAPMSRWEPCSDPVGHNHLADDAEQLVAASGLAQRLSVDRNRQVIWPGLHEATYKELASLIDGNFLQQKVRSEVLQGVRLDHFEDNIAHFAVKSSEFNNNRIVYDCAVQFVDWDEVGQDPDLNFNEKARMLLWVGDIRLHCSCPSFLYHGYNYLLSVLDSAINPEQRPPVRNNPDQRGIVCKHLNRILRVLPVHSGKIAEEIRRQYGEG